MNAKTVSLSFDNPGIAEMRILEAAALQAGEAVDVDLCTDEAALRGSGLRPQFPFAEREYIVKSLRYVRNVFPCHLGKVRIPELPRGWFTTVPDPPPCPENPTSPTKRVLVTGCFDWLHSGHVRFFEEVSELGDLYVIVGSDANIALLKGHAPMFDERVRCYMVNAVRFVKLALISTGQGWMDAEPEIARIKPHIYAVNDDGDRPEKRAFCEQHGIEYRVLKRIPKEGLPRRESTQLRGF
jgi:cytidyltransferase-like protein